MVVMPSMLSRPQSAEALLGRLEIHYLANPDPQFRFALLTDFADAAQETRPRTTPTSATPSSACRPSTHAIAATGPTNSSSSTAAASGPRAG
jgi:hypothetical protein